MFRALYFGHQGDNAHMEKRVKVRKVINQILKKTKDDIDSNKCLDELAQIRNSLRDGVFPSRVSLWMSIKRPFITLFRALEEKIFIKKSTNHKMSRVLKQN